MLAWALCAATGVFVQTLSPGLFYVATSLGVPVLFAHTLRRHAHPTAADVAVACGATWCCIGVCMSVCLHRYFAHRAFRTSRAMQFVLGLFACVAFQGDPLWWTVMHRRHHKHCDQNDDPHSSTVHGVWYAVVGWMASPANYDIPPQEYRSICAEARTPEICALRFLYPVCPISVFFAAASVCGWGPAVYCTLVPMWLARFITLLFNHEFHCSPQAAGKCRAANATRVLAIAVGESQHDDHHQHPCRARRPELDPPYHLIIRPLQALRLVWTCAA